MDAWHIRCTGLPLRPGEPWETGAEQPIAPRGNRQKKKNSPGDYTEQAFL